MEHELSSKRMMLPGSSASDIEGNGSQKELLAIIRKEFSDIYSDFNRRIEYQQLVPCNCQQCQARIELDDKPHYFNWATVQRYAMKEIPQIRCDASLVEVSVAKQMGEIADAEPIELSAPIVKPGSELGESPEAPQWQVITAGTFGVTFLLILLGVAFLAPNPTPFQLVVFRVVLALAAGCIGALIPGFIEVKFRNWLRAAGAMALFAVVYLVNPPALVAG